MMYINIILEGRRKSESALVSEKLWLPVPQYIDTTSRSNLTLNWSNIKRRVLIRRSHGKTNKLSESWSLRQVLMYKNLHVAACQPKPVGYSMSLTCSTMACLSAPPPKCFCYHIRTGRLVVCDMGMLYSEAETTLEIWFKWLICTCGAVRSPLAELSPPTKVRKSHFEPASSDPQWTQGTLKKDSLDFSLIQLQM